MLHLPDYPHHKRLAKLAQSKPCLQSFLEYGEYTGVQYRADSGLKALK